MPEQYPPDEGRDRSKDLRPLKGLDRVKAKVEYRVNPKIKELTEEMRGLLEAASMLDIHSLPRILQLKVENKEYTSIRRVDGNKIVKEEHPAEDNDPFRHIIEYKVDSRLLDEGMIGVLITPFNFNVNPKGRDLAEFLEAQEDLEAHERWGSLLPMAISRGRPFKLYEWEFIWPLVGVVKNQGGEFYAPSDVIVGTIEKGIFGVAKKIQPDSEGRITLLWNSYWWSQEEIEAERQLVEKFATFYVLVEGKSEQERGEASGGLKKLEPRLSEVVS